MSILEQAAQCARGSADVLADGAGEVRLVREAELDRQVGQRHVALLEPVERASAPDPVAVAGE